MSAIAAPQCYDEHYLRDIAALGDMREVVTRSAVWSSTGIKLIEKGVRVDSRMLDRLMRHKLKPSLEQSLSVAQPATTHELRVEAARLLDADSGYALLKGPAGRPGDALEAIENAPIDEGLAVRLTVMRERRPAMFSHALGMAMLAASVVRRGGTAGSSLAAIAAAGLYHDVGEMHVDPQLFAAKKPLTQQERRHIYSHPITSFLILQESQSCGRSIAEAALEHHERLDGSGYPRGIRGAEQCSDGRVLAACELASVFFARPLASGALQRLAVVFKLNHARFDRAITGQLLALAQQDSPAAPPAGAGPDPGDALETIRAIRSVFQDWRTLVAEQDGNGAAIEWVAERMGHLDRTLVEAGLDLSMDDGFIESLVTDPEACVELPAAARELAWLLEEVLHGLQRFPEAASAGPLGNWAASTLRKLARG